MKTIQAHIELIRFQKKASLSLPRTSWQHEITRRPQVHPGQVHGYSCD